MVSVRVLTHSCILLSGAAVRVYADPFRIRDSFHDADVILVTHDHFDHFSPEDIRKAASQNTVLVVPECMRNKTEASELNVKEIVSMAPGEVRTLSGLKIEAVPAYNVNKPFHPKQAAYLGYVVTIEGERVYIAGDTDFTEEAAEVRCDTLLLPVGGKYTMNAEEAAALANRIRPKTAIPTHYGSVAGTENDGEAFLKRLNPGIQGKILKEY